MQTIPCFLCSTRREYSPPGQCSGMTPERLAYDAVMRRWIVRDSRAGLGMVAALVLSAAFGAGDQYLGTLSHHPWGAARSLSAPWLVLPFVVGAAQRDARRAAALGFACTFVALCGYGLMMLSPVGTHHLALGEAQGYLGNERNVFLASIVTGPLFGWFGWRWRSREAIWSAVLTAAALSLEPVARIPVKPIRFLDVATAEVGAGLVLAATALVRQYRQEGRGLTVLLEQGRSLSTIEQPDESHLGRLGTGFAIAGICVALGVIAVCAWIYWVASHFAAGIG